MSPIASIIKWQNNADAESYGVAILTLANRTDINVLGDIVGKIVSFEHHPLVSKLPNALRLLVLMC